MSKAKATMENNRKHHVKMLRDFLLSYKMLQKKQVHKKHSRGSTRNRVRRSVEDMYKILGPEVWRKAYQMSFESFLNLYDKIWPYLHGVCEYNIDGNGWYIHNGRIHP